LKAFIDALTPGSGSDDDQTATRSEPPDWVAKEGRTLSTANQESLFATIDASLDVLEDAGVDHSITRFTDREDTDFDLSEHDARAFDEDEDEDMFPLAAGDADEDGGESSKHAAGGDTPGSTTTMSDSDGGDGDKSLAEKNAEQISQLTSAVEGLTEAVTGPQPKTAEIEIDGETHEVREDVAKAALGIDGADDVGNAIQRLNEKTERVDEVEQRLDTIATQSGLAGQSDQITRGANGDGGDEDESLDNLAKLLS